MRKIMWILFMMPGICLAGMNAGDLAAVASDVNKRTPMMVDNDTRLDKVDAKGGSKLVYNYTMVNYSYNQFDKKKFTNSFKGSLTKHTCSKLREFISQGVEIVYHYRSSDGKYLTQISVRKSDC